MEAPVCVAKGVDAVALKIREVAGEHSIPIVENPPLARALHATVEIDQAIPRRALQGGGRSDRLRHAAAPGGCQAPSGTLYQKAGMDRLALAPIGRVMALNDAVANTVAQIFPKTGSHFRDHALASGVMAGEKPAAQPAGHRPRRDRAAGFRQKPERPALGSIGLVLLVAAGAGRRRRRPALYRAALRGTYILALLALLGTIGVAALFAHGLRHHAIFQPRAQAIRCSRRWSTMPSTASWSPTSRAACSTPMPPIST